MKPIIYRAGVALVVASSLCLAKPAVARGEDEDKEGGQKGFIRSIERTRGEKRQVSWLGVAVEEAPAVLDAQLSLNCGQGLVVTMVATNSPAFKAELRKDDVLAEFDGQMLMDAVQLRKLVQMHAEGDTINLTLFRGGKKISISPKLGKTTWDDNAMDEYGQNQDFKLDLSGLKNLGPEIREEMGVAAKALEAPKAMLSHINFDKEAQRKATLEMKRAMDEARRGLEEARRAIERAVREHPGEMSVLGSADKDMEDLTGSGVDLDKDATVVIKKDLKSARSIVTTDDSGDYIIIADPKKRLTVHDHSGKLLFDGAIETPEEQDKVPKDVWEKVKPMLDQIGTIQSDKPQSNRKNPLKITTRLVAITAPENF